HRLAEALLLHGIRSNGGYIDPSPALVFRTQQEGSHLVHLGHVFGRELVGLEMTVGGGEQIAILQLDHRSPPAHARDRLAPVVETIYLSLGQHEAVLLRTLQCTKSVFGNPEAGLESLVPDVLGVDVEEQNASITKLCRRALGDGPAAVLGARLPFLPALA